MNAKLRGQAWRPFESYALFIRTRIFLKTEVFFPPLRLASTRNRCFQSSKKELFEYVLQTEDFLKRHLNYRIREDRRKRRVFFNLMTPESWYYKELMRAHALHGREKSPFLKSIRVDGDLITVAKFFFEYYFSIKQLSGNYMNKSLCPVSK